jgi:hypothetical protein
MLKSTSFPLISCDHKKHMAIQCLRYIIGYKNGIFISRRKGMQVRVDGNIFTDLFAGISCSLALDSVYYL